MYSVKVNLELWVTGNLYKCTMQKAALSRSKIMCRSSSQYKTTLKRQLTPFITKYKCVSVSAKYISDLTKHS